MNFRIGHARFTLPLGAVGLFAAGLAAGVTFVISCNQIGESTAQDMAGGGGCGSCTVNGPIAVSSVGNPVTVETVNQPVKIDSIDQPVKVAGPVDVNVASGMITLPGTLKVLTADTDINQLEAGSVTVAAGGWALVAKGPFVLTDVYGTYTSSSFHVGPGNACPPAKDTFGIDQSAVHGARYPIPAGSVLCYTSAYNATAEWSGYKPY